jgi:ketosteroid isomerase-like protein
LSDEQQVLAVEQEWVDAEIARDEAVLRRVIDERFALNSSDGKTADKATTIAGVLAWNLVSQTITERTVLVDGDTAIVFGTANLRFSSDGKDATTSLLRYTATYIKRRDGWRALGLHMSKHASN